MTIVDVARGSRTEWTRPDRRRPVRRAGWWRAYPYILGVLDAIAMALASAIAIASRFATDEAGAARYSMLTALAPLGWVVIMNLSRAYERRFIGVGSDEFRRVVDGALRTTALVATAAFAFKVNVSRGFVGIALPLATILTLLLRWGARRVLHHGRQQSGRWSHRVLAVGSTHTVSMLLEQTRSAAYAGMDVVGALLVTPGAVIAATDEIDGIPVMGGLVDLVSVLETESIDTVAVTDANVLGPQALRRIAWALEGRGIDLVVSPSLTDVAARASTSGRSPVSRSCTSRRRSSPGPGSS